MGKRILDLSPHSGVLTNVWVPVQQEGQPVAQRRLASDIAGTGEGGASSASAVSFSPSGGIAATNVQAALAELDGEKALATRSISAGVGLSGGGTLASDRTLSLDIAGLTQETTVDGANDMLVMYDASVAGYRKVAPGNLPAGTGTAFAIAVSIVWPEAATYTIVRSPGYGFTVGSLVHITDVGTLTAALQIDGVAVTGLSAVAVDSSETTTNATGSNVMGSTARLQITLSNVSGVGEVNFTIRAVRS